MSLVILAVLAAALSGSTASPLKDPKICGRPSCPGTGKFKYFPGVQYEYKYSVNARTLFAGSSNNESSLSIEARLILDFISPCEGILQVKNVKIFEDSRGYPAKTPPKSNEFSTALNAYPLRFAFQDGTIPEVCPEEGEATWVVNFKKGILSSFQNTMKRFDIYHESTDVDVNGNCETHYSLQGIEGTSLIIRKEKDILSCVNRYQHHSVIQSTSYKFRSNYQPPPIMKSNSSCLLSVDHNVYNKIECEEVHLFQPFSHAESGAKTITKQTFQLVTETNSTVAEQGIITRREPMLFDHGLIAKTTTDDIKVPQNMMRRMCQLNNHDVDSGFPDVFSNFIHVARLLSYSAISDLYKRAPTICSNGKRHLIDALPLLGSNAAVQLMTDIITEESIPKLTVNEWLFAITFIPRPNLETISILTPLLTNNSSNSEEMFAVSSVVHSYCKWNHDCHSNDEVTQVVSILENQLLDNCQHFDKSRTAHDRLLVKLKAVGNIGLSTKPLSLALQRCIQDENLPMELRIAAIEAHRRLPCEPLRDYFLEMYRNKNIDPEIRIASYLQVMQCPNYIVIKTIKHTLIEEDVNQVGSFVWSHLNNLLTSSMPSRVEIQGLLQNNDLGKKFSSDVRKFSHNFEGSVFLDEYNVGGSYESNVIFSPKSYIPRSATLNVTVDLFGESINVFEVGSRVEGFEKYIESVFGPKGPLSSTNINEEIHKVFRRSATNEIQESINQLPNVMDNNINDPKVSLSLKIFGNEVKHQRIVGHQELMNALSSINPMKRLSQILSGKEIYFKKSALFLDTNYVIPTGTGLPINLNAVGSSSVNLKLSGLLKAENFASKGELDIKAEVRPSVAVDITGTMGIDAFCLKTGIKLKANLYSSSAVEGQFLVRGSKSVSVSFNLPKEKSEIIKAQSELLVLRNGIEEHQVGIEKGKIKGQNCTWPTLDQTLGLKICADYQFPYPDTNITNSSSFLLNGPIKFEIFLKKADPTAKKYFLEYKYESNENSANISLIFDTPGSKQKRELSFRMTLDKNGQNLTLLIHSANNIYKATGTYKNTPRERFFNFVLDINGRKNFDARASVKMREEKYGNIYEPLFYLAINDTRIAELSGTIRWMDKKNITQCDVTLEFETKKFAMKLVGFLKKSESLVGLNFKIDYQFAKSKQEHVKIGAFFVSKSSNRGQGELKLQLSNYSQFNFISLIDCLKIQDHVSVKIDLTVGPELKDERSKLHLEAKLNYLKQRDSTTIDIVIQIKKQISSVDLKLSLKYVAKGPETNVKSVIRYATGKEILIELNLKQSPAQLTHIEGKLNVTIPGFNPFVLELWLHEKFSNNYDIDFHAEWISGHSVNVKGVYQDRSTSKASNHNLKFGIKSPSFSDIILTCKLIRDDKELKVDIMANYEENNYSLLVKHNSPTQDEFKTEIQVRWKLKIYSLIVSANLSERKEISLDLHLDQLRNIHILLKGLNKPQEKEAGLEIKWDANRDPLQKFVFYVKYDHPEFMNYSGNFQVSFPGRTVNGGLVFAAKDLNVTSLAFIEWNPTDKIKASFSASYKYDNIIMLEMKFELLTPYESWKKTSLSACFHHEGNMCQIHGGLHWQDNQNIQLDLFGNYLMTESHFECEFNSSVISTVEQVPAMSASFFHKQGGNKYDTKLYLQYMPKQIISVRSSWELEEKESSTILTGTVSLTSPFTSYQRGVLVSRLHYDSDWKIGGVANLNFDRRTYSMSLEGHLQKLSNNYLVFNITTPLQNYTSITGRFGFSEEKRHFVALVKTPINGIGIEILFYFEDFNDFDIEFNLLSPIEIVQQALLITKFKQDMADFRVGWNKMMLGLSGVWIYENITNFEYSAKIYTPLNYLEESGVTAKLFTNVGHEESGVTAKSFPKVSIDFEASVLFAYKKLGLRVQGAPKPQPPIDLKLANKKLDRLDDKTEDYPDDDFEAEEIKWKGLIQIDTVIYTTIKGELDIDEKDSLYSVFAIVALPNGTVELHDELYFEDIFTINNILTITTPWKSFSRVESNLDWKVDFGYEYVLTVDMKYKSEQQWMESGLFMNLTTVTRSEEESFSSNHFHVHVFTPIQSFKMFDMKAKLDIEGTIYNINLNVSGNGNVLNIYGSLETGIGYTGINAGVGVRSPNFNIPAFKLFFKKDFSGPRKKLSFELTQLRPNVEIVNFSTAWTEENNTYISIEIKLCSPIDKKFSLRSLFLWSKDSINKTSILKFYSIYSEKYETRLNSLFQGNDFSVDIQLPIKNYRNMQFEGIITEDNGNKIVQGSMKSGVGNYRISGTLTCSLEYPLKGEITMTPINAGNHPITIGISLQKKTDGYQVYCKILQGTERLETNLKITMQDGQSCKVDLKVESTHMSYKELLLTTFLKKQYNNYLLEVNGHTPFEDFEKINLFCNFQLEDTGSIANVSLDLPKTKASLVGKWIWQFMDHMEFYFVSSLHHDTLSKTGEVKLFYINQNRKLNSVLVGMDTEFNNGAWQFGTNATLIAPSGENLTISINLKLPTPNIEVHTIKAKLYYDENFAYFNNFLKYFTQYSRRSYGYSVLVDKKKEKNMSNLILQWGEGKIKTVNNTFEIKKSIRGTNILYILKSPLYEENTCVASAIYSVVGNVHSAKADIFWPEHTFIAGSDISYMSVKNMNGKINTTTPFTLLPYAAVIFNLTSESINNHQNLKFFWPNNTALLNSEYKYIYVNHNINIVGKLDAELPLATRHYGTINYNYEGQPFHKTGAANVVYNKENVIQGKYICNSKSSAGHEEDDINIVIENKYSPLEIHYKHLFDYSGSERRLPTNDRKSFDIFRKDNKTIFSLKGYLNIVTTSTGKEIAVSAIHANRTVKLQTEYNYLENEFQQRSTLDLGPNSWVSYDLTLSNKSKTDIEEEHIKVNFAYPKRNFTALGYYYLATDKFSSELSLEWDKHIKERNIGGSIDWKRLSRIPNRQHAVISVKHPSFQRDVTLDGNFSSDDIDIFDIKLDLQYSPDLEQKLSLAGKLQDRTTNSKREYLFELLGNHPPTSLDLEVKGNVKLDGIAYQTSNTAKYKRSYLPLQRGMLKGKYDSVQKELDLQKEYQGDLSYIKGKYMGRYPEYKVNGAILSAQDYNSTGYFYIDFNEKLLNVTYINKTLDTDSLESLHIDGRIPDSRNALLNIWRDYEDISISDVAFYLRLNHSRLVTSKLIWRPDLKQDIQKSIEAFLRTVYETTNNTIDYWKKYIYSEINDAVEDIWKNANPTLKYFLDDAKALRVLQEDFETFKISLNNSYNANDFYIRDIVDMGMYILDQLAIRGHIESLPKIFNEIWEVMGESGESIRKSILWVIETIKNTYSKLMDLLNKIMNGDTTSQLSDMLEKFAEKYDKIIKDIHVSMKKQLEDLWSKLSIFLLDSWNSILKLLEPEFVKFAHYVETLALKFSQEVVDFLYLRKAEIVESPYFSKFAKLKQDLDKVYTDIISHDAITNFKKYSKIIYEFLKEKYFSMVPFGRELQDVASEIINEFKELRKLHSINFLITKLNELYDQIVILNHHLDLGTKFQKAVVLIQTKVIQSTQTALQTENRYREAKTKFIFDPEHGIVDLEQKLPMSWHAFNETPRFEEIPEYKRINELQNQFDSYNFTFWAVYYKYKSLTEPSNWLPPFQAQAVVAGLQHFITFDKKFYEFQGSCTYLLTTDFTDRNFAMAIKYHGAQKSHSYEIILLVDGQIVQVDVFKNTVKLSSGTVKQLPIAIGDAYIYQESELVIIESARGFSVQCNLKFDLCTINLSGWYYGKTFGLLGTMDKEPTTDFLTSRKIVETDVGRFAQSWALEPNKCGSAKNFAENVTVTHKNIQNLCEAFFKSKASQFQTCFTVVDPSPFFDMCMNNRGSDEMEACTTAIAYMQACDVEHTPLRIPDACVKCRLSNGTELVEGNFQSLKDGDIPRSTDIVFIIEARECNRYLNEANHMDLVASYLTTELTSKGFISNRFAVVVFGGNGVYDRPRSIVVDNNIFTTPQLISQYFENIPTGNGSKDIFGALSYAAKLIFRAGVSKTFILLPCSNCDSSNMVLDYAVLHQFLLEKGITLHILMNDEFTVDKPRLQKSIYGIDAKHAFTKNDVRLLKGDENLKKQVKKPKALLGVCTALALETNGTIFTAKQLNSDKKNAIKKFLTVFSKRIVHSAYPINCQHCECTADNNGISYMECNICEHYIPDPIYDIPSDSEENTDSLLIGEDEFYDEEDGD